MTGPVHFPNAPITEAVLDLRTRPSTEAQLSALDPFVEAVRQDYPGKRVRTEIEARVQFDREHGAVQTEGTGSPVGYLLSSKDGRQVVQARRDGFAFSRLKPYQDWTSMKDEARRLWQLYNEVARPQRIIRIALRYINRVEIPVPKGGFEFSEYFLTAPEIAPGISQEMANFFMRLLVPDEGDRGVTIITETVDSKALSRSLFPLIFDIDAFKEAEFDPEGEEGWDALEQLRDLKNEIFMRSFTDKAKELFK